MVEILKRILQFQKLREFFCLFYLFNMATDEHISTTLAVITLLPY
jgi:hypothetical protein